MRLKPQVRGYKVIGVGVGGRHHPKLRSAYLGFSGVSPLRGFLRLCRWGVSFPQAALRLHAVMAVQIGYCGGRLVIMLFA